jgi:hypothetical protein
MKILLFGLDISGWIASTGAIVIVGAIVTLLRKKGLILNIKYFFGFMSKITKEVGEAFLESSDVFAEADKAIREDGHLIENSVKDVIREGKEAIIEWKDVIMIVKPKK